MLVRVERMKLSSDHPNINNKCVPLFIRLLVIPNLLKCHITDPCTFRFLIIVVASHYTTMFHHITKNKQRLRRDYAVLQLFYDSW